MEIKHLPVLEIFPSSFKCSIPGSWLHPGGLTWDIVEHSLGFQLLKHMLLLSKLNFLINTNIQLKLKLLVWNSGCGLFCWTMVRSEVVTIQLEILEWLKVHQFVVSDVDICSQALWNLLKSSSVNSDTLKGLGFLDSFVWTTLVCRQDISQLLGKDLFLLPAHDLLTLDKTGYTATQ